MSRLPDFSARGSRPVAPPGGERAWLVAGGLLLVAALLAGWRAQSDLELARAQLERAREAARNSREPAPGRAERLDPADLELRAQAGLSPLAPPPRVLAELAALLPRGVRFERIGLTYGSDLRLQLQVRAREAPDYDRFLEALEASPRFAEVVPGSENREGELRSTLELRYVPEARP